MTIFALLAIMGVVAVQSSNHKSGGSSISADYSSFKRDNILALKETIDFSKYDPETTIEPSEDTGNISEKFIGDKTAPVIIYEYADYACSHCADMNTALKKLVEQYNGRVAVAFRGYILNGFPHNVAVSSAANAAFIQSPAYWEKFKNLIFSDQATWFYLEDDEIVSYLTKTFAEASDNKGDMNKFYRDLTSENVAKRIAFDYGLGEKVGLTGTPHLRVNGKQVKADELVSTIDSLLEKK